MTPRLYLEDSYQREFSAEVLEYEDGWCVLSRTVFYPGGGGQPCDRGQLLLEDGSVEVSEIREDDAGRLWHRIGRALAPGQAVRGTIDWSYRHALMRHHGLMHVVNTVARQHFGGVITGVQLGPEESRIDFKLTGFSREQTLELESRVNEVLQHGHSVTSSVISEDEFRARPELIRTLNVLPPVVEGRVRIVEIEGFDVQACGGTHVHSTREIGQARIRKFDNKGKDNKRFYWTLTA